MTRPPPRSTLFPYTTLFRSVNLTINENAGLQTVNLSGISSGATNEAQVLTVTAISSNPALIPPPMVRSEEHTSELQSHSDLVCRLLLEDSITVTVSDGGSSN